MPRRVRRRSLPPAAFLATPLLALLGAALAAARPVRPQEAAPAFVPHEVCARCHTTAPAAAALRDADGFDVSPVRLWRGTLMANSARDPYWRAQLAREVELHPDRTEELHSLCTRCHAPMAWHTDELAGAPHRGPAELAGDPLAEDGVSCTLCHRIDASGLGEERSFDGRFELTAERVLHGPYERPFAMPMRRFSGFTPVHGPHVSSSALCGSCHTLVLEHASAHGGTTEFPEQAPYLEWRNSVFSTEGMPGPEATTCQGCHMADHGATRIARNPAGRDFPPVRERPGVRGHAFVGGNAWMLDLLREEATRFGTTDRVAELALAAAATRRQLQHETAGLEVVAVERTAGAETLRVGVRVTNRTGHKLPTAYPSRRAWVYFEARRGDEVLLRSGAVDAHGRLVGVADELALPHYDVVRAPDEVCVYEAVAEDADGRVTTSLVDMRRWRKDSRLLPRGWRADGPEAARTSPHGLAGDDRPEQGGDFVGGSDVVHFEFADLPGPAAGPLTVRVELRYQSIPPAWVDALRSSETEEAREFVALYDARGAGFERLAAVEHRVDG